MRAFITGVTGFAGGHLAEHLLFQGDVVLGSSNTGRWLPESPTDLAPRVPLMAWDLAAAGLDTGVLDAVASFAPQVIYHLAAISIPADCGTGTPTPLALAVNVGGTRAVLDMAARLPSRPRVLLVSSSHVYASVGPDDPPIDELWPVKPRGAYGHTKWGAEQAVHEAIARDGVDAVIVRAFQHAGPRQVGALMLPDWMAQCAGGKAPIKVYNCSAAIDFCDVRDVVRAYRLIAVNGHAGTTYNVGSGVARRSGDVLEMLFRLAGHRPFVEERSGPHYDPIANCRRMRADTGWRPTIPLEQTVADTYAWWLTRHSGSH